MTTRSLRRRTTVVGLGAVLGLLTLGAPPAAGEVIISEAPIPLPVCDPALAEEFFVALCVEITLTEGQAKFGGVESAVSGPIVIRQVIGVDSTFTPVIVDESDGAPPQPLSFPAINVPGGLFAGVPVLEDIPIPGVTDVRAVIEPLGPVTTSPSDLGVALFGDGLLTTATLPLRVRVDNLALGETCYIGSVEEPIVFNLPVQVGVADQLVPEPGGNSIGIIASADLTDDTFAVPAATGCGIAGSGTVLEDLGLGQANVFNQLVNDSVGLPSPSGNNLLDFDGFYAIVGAGL